MSHNPFHLKRLIKAMCRAACLSPFEARAVIRMHRLGYDYSCEAANHYGGNKRVIQDAIRMRHVWDKPTTLNDLIHKY